MDQNNDETMLTTSYKDLSVVSKEKTTSYKDLSVVSKENI